MKYEAIRMQEPGALLVNDSLVRPSAVARRGMLGTIVHSMTSVRDAMIYTVLAPLS